MNSDKPVIDFSDKFSLAYPKRQILYLVSQRDWERLKMMLKNIVNHSNWCQIILSTSIGIFVTSIFTLISFYSSEGTVNWAKNVGWVILGISSALSLACFFFNKSLKKNACFVRNQIVNEMESIESSFDVSEDEKVERHDLSQILIKNKWRLYFNPSIGASKIMTFDEEGVIRAGKNKNESSWRIHDGILEFVSLDDDVFSRFKFDFKKHQFVHTNDEDTRSIRNQYMILDNS